MPKIPLNLRDRPFSTNNPRSCENILANFRWRRGLTLANIENRLGYRVNEQKPEYDDYGRILYSTDADGDVLPQSKAIRPRFKIRKWEKGWANNKAQEVPANMLLFELPVEFYEEMFEVLRAEPSKDEVLSILYDEMNPSKNKKGLLLKNFEEGSFLDRVVGDENAEETECEEIEEPRSSALWRTIIKRWGEISGLAYKRLLLKMFLFLIYTAE